MNKRLKAKWVKALRSGKYTQTKEALCRTAADGAMSYCCLGVLQAVAPQVSGSWGFLHEDSSGIDRATQTKLAAYNDRGGKSFAWIASNIERRKSL